MSAPNSIFDVRALPPTFRDTFDGSTLDANTWQVSQNSSPGVGSFDASYVLPSSNGLALALTQTGSAANSFGAEVTSVNAFGFGVVQVTARVASTATTADGAGQSVSGSLTRLQGFTVPGNAPYRLDAGTVFHLGDLSQGFHTYAVWRTATSVRFFVDGLLLWTQTTDVPQDAAPIVLSVWGTDDADAGGLASLNTTRRAFIRDVTFWSLEP